VRTTHVSRLLVVALVTPMLFASCAQAPEMGEPVATIPVTHELTIIGTSDLHGALEPTLMEIDVDGDGKPEKVEAGGMPRLATLIRQIEAEAGHPVVVISSGDELTGHYYHNFKGEATYTLMNAAGYEISCYGNHEFDLGPAALAHAVSFAHFDRLCTDLSVAGTPLEGTCEPFIVEDYDGLTVGYFSIMTESLPYVSSPKEVTLTGTNLETAHRAVKELHNAGAELIVCISHTGLDNDLEVARSVPGIDIIYGGHSHTYTQKPRRVGGTLVVNAGTKGPYLVRMDVVTDADGHMLLDQVDYELIPVVDPIVPAADVEAKLAEFRNTLPEAVVLGRTDVDWDLSKEAVRGGASSVANMINDRMRTKFGVDIVLNNAGAFRGRGIYKAGPVTDVMLSEIDEFKNDAYLFDLEGRYILPILEHSAASFGEGGLLQVSGLKYTVDLTKSAQVISRSDDGTWSVDSPGERVVDVQVLQDDGTWAPLDPDRTYRILANSFLVAHEGDGYFWFKAHLTNMENTYSTFYSIMAEIAANEGVLNPEPPDDRMTVLQ
jgi:5'-nucleotidase/UDP-sugar diphosphatase